MITAMLELSAYVQAGKGELSGSRAAKEGMPQN
jgi:hypothetical protein